MNKFLLILVSLPLLTLSSCKKESKSWGVEGPAIELSFVDSYSAPSGVNTRATPPPVEEFEMKVTSLVLLAYTKGATTSATPLIKYVFSQNELEKMRAVIPLGSIASGAELDFYVVANAVEKYPVLGSASQAEPTITELQSMTEKNSMSTYNKGQFELFATQGVNQVEGAARGFVMSDKQTVAIVASGSGAPTQVAMRLNRTVARVDVTAKVTSVFDANYPDADLTIKSATIKFEPQKGNIILQPETMAESIVNASLAKDSLVQNNYSAEKTKEGKFRYYPYPCADRNASALKFGTGSGTVSYDPTIHKHMLLTIVAEFSYEEGKFKTINYKIPLTGTGEKGAFHRNALYEVIVNIDGLTDQEIKASIKIADWESVVTQTVNIGG